MNNRFSAFLDDSRCSANQIRFVETIIDRLTHSGVIDPGQLYEPPFTAFHYEGVEGTFGDSDAEGIFGIIEEITVAPRLNASPAADEPDLRRWG